MNFASQSFFNNLERQITNLEARLFTGELSLIFDNNLEFQLYLCLGRAIWVDGGNHPYRCWRRLVAKYCSEIEFDPKDIDAAERFKCWNYQLLTILLQRDLISFDTFSNLIREKFDEFFFDIIQLSQTKQFTFTSNPTSGDSLLSYGLKVSLTLIPLKQAFDRSLETWSQWCDRSLETISPNLAPIVQDKQRLALQVSAKTYENLLKIIDGHHTLRDLAVITNQDIIPLTVSLISYLDSGLFKLEEIEDISKSSLNISARSPKQKSPSDRERLTITVACIDDSPQALGIMAEILQRAEFNFIGIKDPLEAIPKLLLSNPDIIFLDVAMPLMNGYEVCAQLRRVPELEKIPVVMLTVQDGMVDRVRAKMAGASGFISKPITAARIIGNIVKFVNI